MARAACCSLHSPLLLEAFQQIHTTFDSVFRACPDSEFPGRAPALPGTVGAVFFAPPSPRVRVEV